MNQTTVLEVGGLNWASSRAAVEATLLRRPGVTSVEANPVNQTATVTYDPEQTSVADLSKWVRDCGFHCAGRSVPDHVCDPMAEPAVAHAAAPAAREMHAAHEAPAGRSPQEMMGHGGGHAGMSMDDDGSRHAQPVPGGAGVVDPDHAVVPDRPRHVRIHGAGAVRPARRRLHSAVEPAGGLLLGLDLLRRRVPGAEGPDAGHDGARRRRGRGRLALQRRQ